MFHCPAVPQSGRGFEEHLCDRNSWFCSTKALCRLPEPKGVSSQLWYGNPHPNRATLSPDIFTIAQPLLWDQDKGGRECASSNSVKEFSQSQHVLHSANKQRKVFLDALCLGSREKKNRNNLYAVLLLFFLFCFILFLYLNVIQSKTNDTF